MKIKLTSILAYDMYLYNTEVIKIKLNHNNIHKKHIIILVRRNVILYL